MNNKILFFDIDGTLLAGGVPGYIPDSTIKALEQAQKNGHALFINSGRTYSFLPESIKAFPFDGYLCGCGTEIIVHGETIFHNIIPENIRRGLRDILRKTGIQAVYEGHDACFYDSGIEPFPPIIMLQKTYLDNHSPADSLRTFDDEELNFDKFVIFTSKDSDFAGFEREIGDYFFCTREERPVTYNFGEVTPRHCTKATGIDLLVEHLGGSLGNCYIFGDSTNDLPMFRHVKNSVAMGNSTPDILEIASYVTTPVDRDGIWLAMKHFQLI